MLHVAKETAGQHFEGLNMLTSLLAPKGSTSAKPLVEDAGACGGGCEEEDEDEFDWQIEQPIYPELPAELLKENHKYGFGNLRSGVFPGLQIKMRVPCYDDELEGVIDVTDPDSTAPEIRRRDRMDYESTMFSYEFYLACFYDDKEKIMDMLKLKPWWRNPDTDASVTFTEEEKEQLRKLPNRSYLLDKKARFHIWLGLVDILLSYVHNVITTDLKHNVESAWTIKKLSGTLSWLETYHSVHDVLVSFGRRALTYPLTLHFSLVTRAVEDVAWIFQCGKACVLKCLLTIHKIFQEFDTAYILNDLYITDYCIWIQRVKSKNLFELAEILRNAKLQKSDLELCLEVDVLDKPLEMTADEENEGKEGSEEEEKEEEQEEMQPEEVTENNQVGSQAICEVLKEEAMTEASPLSAEIQHGGGEPRESRCMIEALEEGLRIEEDVPLGRRSISGSNTEGERKGEGDDYHRCAAETERDATKAGTSRELLEPCLQRNPLRIISTEELDSDDDGDLLTMEKEGP